ncbi:MAG: hypothetical protein IKJ63_11135 [Clostridia bacterium]|nr:hypothetical protein [Clostridia bacterium]
MPVLSLLPNTEKVNVLRSLEKMLIFEEEVKRRKSQVEIRINDEQDKVRKNKKMRLIIMGLVLFFSIQPLFVAFAFAITSLMGESFGTMEFILLVGGFVVFFAIITAEIIFCKRFQKKNKQDVANAGKYIAAVSPYLSFYDQQLATIARRIAEMCNQNRINRNLTSIAVIEYVVYQLSCYPNKSLDSIVNDFYEKQDRERMIQIAQEKNAILEKTRKEAQAFYDDAIHSIESGNQAIRDGISQTNDMLYHHFSG